MHITKDSIRQLIADDRVDEAIDALIAQARLYLTKNKNNKFVSKISDVLVINSGKLSGLMHDSNLGILDKEEAKITKAEIQKATLYAIEQLPDNVFLIEEIVEETIEEIEVIQKEPEIENTNKQNNQKQVTQPQQTNKKGSKISIISFIFLIFLVLFIWQPWRDREKEAFNEAKTQNTVDAFEMYLSDYPEGKYIKQAKNKIEEIAFFNCSIIANYHKFIAKYPNGKFQDQAKVKIKELEIKEIEDKGEIVWQNDKSGYFIDQRDKHKYKVVKIGKQIWMAENLAYELDEGCSAYDNDKSNIAKYGYLYTWDAGKSACPNGWRLPMREDVSRLLRNVGYGGLVRTQYPELIKGGKSGFDVVFGGYGSTFGLFGAIGNSAKFSTMTPSDDGKKRWVWVLEKDKKTIYVTTEYGYQQTSVRCIKNSIMESLIFTP